MAKSSTRNTFIASLIPMIILGFGFLMWPVTSDHWNIEWDDNKLRQKENMLEDLTVNQALDDRPNIILILADDLGKYDISLYGHPHVHTPNIDRLARDGVRFEQAYVSAAVCAPSRAGLLTGRYQHRFGFENQTQERYLKNRLEYYGMNWFVNSDPWKIHYMTEVPNTDAMDKQGLPPTEITIAEVLKTAGYHTSLIGKWHLGKTQGQTPCDFGFDYYYGFYGSHSLYIHEGTSGYVDQKIPDDWTDKYIWKGQRDGVYAVRRNCRVIQEDGYLTDRIAEESIDIIRAYKDSSFFIYIPFGAPHTPLQAHEDDVALFDHIQDPVKRTYYAMITSLDRAIGKIVREVEDQG